MRSRERDIAAAGAGIVFVGTGTPAMAGDFAESQAGGHPVLTDPERRAFALAGMRRGWWTVLRPSMLVHALRALRAGHRQTRVQGDAWQLGGLCVLDAAGRVAHVQRDAVAGAPLDLDAALRSLRSPPGR